MQNRIMHANLGNFSEIPSNYSSGGNSLKKRGRKKILSREDIALEERFQQEFEQPAR